MVAFLAHGAIFLAVTLIAPVSVLLRVATISLTQVAQFCPIVVVTNCLVDGVAAEKTRAVVGFFSHFSNIVTKFVHVGQLVATCTVVC